MLGFGVIGYIFKKLDYPLAPMVLALVLGNNAEDCLSPGDADVPGRHDDHLVELAGGQHHHARRRHAVLAADLEGDQDDFPGEAEQAGGAATRRVAAANAPRGTGRDAAHHAAMNANLYALLRNHFAENLDQPCILIPGGPVIHYDDLDAASARMAHALLAAGCAAGDRVAVQTDKCWQALALYLACLRAGLVYLPLNTGYRKGELALFFRRCRAARHRLRSRRRRRLRPAARRGDGADARRRRGQPARSRARPARRISTR